MLIRLVNTSVVEIFAEQNFENFIFLNFLQLITLYPVLSEPTTIKLDDAD